MNTVSQKGHQTGVLEKYWLTCARLGLESVDLCLLALQVGLCQCDLSMSFLALVM